ncbi:MAG TPA: threonine synthase, partial [Brevundimonas sp.]
SNFERLVFEGSGRDAEATRAMFETFARDGQTALPADLLLAIRAEVSAVSIDEATTRSEIAQAYETWGRVVCPHTAVALAAARRQPTGGPMIALSTAHAAKFGKDVAPVLGFDPDPPHVIRELGDRPERLTLIDGTHEAALEAVRSFRR